jgi:hypothetical protein
MKVVAVPQRLRIEESARIAREKFGAYLIASQRRNFDISKRSPARQQAQENVPIEIPHFRFLSAVKAEYAKVQ